MSCHDLDLNGKVPFTRVLLAFVLGEPWLVVVVEVGAGFSKECRGHLSEVLEGFLSGIRPLPLS